MLDRPPRGMADGDVLDIGGTGLRRTVLELATPHVPHNWESHVFFEQQTRTLFCGDLCTQLGDGAPVTDADLLDAAIAAEEMFWHTSMGPAIPAAYRRLADLQPATLAVMHGSSYNGDCARLLRDLADVYESRFGCHTASDHAQALPGHDAPVGASR